MKTQENLQYSPEIEGNKQFHQPETTFPFSIIYCKVCKKASGRRKFLQRLRSYLTNEPS